MPKGSKTTAEAVEKIKNGLIKPLTKSKKDKKMFQKLYFQKIIRIKFCKHSFWNYP